MLKIKYCVMAGLVALGVALQANAATTLTIGDGNDLGLITPNHPANPTDSAAFINILLDQALGSGPTVVGANAYLRTLNDPAFGTYPDAVLPGFVEFGEEVTDIDLGSGFMYLLAKYDGQNYGSRVWYVGGLTGEITIPLNGLGDQYAVSHTYLFNPAPDNPPGEPVPDGGLTVALLGLALTGIGFLRRKMA